MPLEFLDTNLIIRYITQDVPDLARRSQAFLQQLQQGAATANTCEGVIVEAVQVLSSKSLYNLPRGQIRTGLSAIIRLKGLRIPHKRTYLRALDVYVSYPALDFVDALEVAHMERLGIGSIVSFDRDFDRVPAIRRREPSL